MEILVLSQSVSTLNPIHEIIQDIVEGRGVCVCACVLWKEVAFAGGEGSGCFLF